MSNMSAFIKIFVQARLSSSRLPGKVLRDMGGKPMLLRQIERLRYSQHAAHVVVLTSLETSDDPLATFCAQQGVACFRGSLEDVLDRFYQASLQYPAEHYVRLTGDCPLVDPVLLDAMIETYQTGQYDYFSNVHPRTFAQGFDIEMFSHQALTLAWQQASLPYDREHVTPYMYRETTELKRGNYHTSEGGVNFRVTVDYLEDFEVVARIFEVLETAVQPFTVKEVVNLLIAHPAWVAHNALQSCPKGAML